MMGSVQSKAGKKKRGCLAPLFTIILVGFLLLILGGGAGVFWFDQFVKSPEFHEKIRKSVSEAIGAEIMVEKTTFDPTSGFLLEGVSIANDAPHADSAFLSMEKLNVSYSLEALFGAMNGGQQALVVSKIESTQPEMMLFQTKDGGLELPFKPKGESVSVQTQFRPLMLTLDAVELLRGRIEFMTADGDRLVLAEKMHVSGKVDIVSGGPSADGTKAVGSILMGALTMGNSLRFERLASPVTYQKDALVFSKLTADLYQGKADGMGSVTFGKPDPGFELSFNLKDVAIEKGLESMQVDSGALQGKLHLDMKVKGKLAAPKDLEGSGTLRIVSARIGDSKALAALQRLKVVGNILGVRELQEGRLDIVRANYEIAGQKVEVRHAEMESGNLKLSAAGSVGFDKTLDLKGSIVYDPPLYLKVAMAIYKEKLPSGSEGYQYQLPLTVAGSIDEPDVKIAGISIFPETLTKEFLQLLMAAARAETGDQEASGK